MCLAAPTAVSAVAGDGQATVSWTAPARTVVARSPATPSPRPPVVRPTPASGTSVLVTGLTNGTAYTFTVTATNTVGTGPASALRRRDATAAPTAPGAPTAVGAIAGDGQATVSWTAPSERRQPDYRLHRDVVTGCNRRATPALPESTVTGLTNGIAYTFTVTATNSVGTGPSSSPRRRSPRLRPDGARRADGRERTPATPRQSCSWTAPVQRRQRDHWLHGDGIAGRRDRNRRPGDIGSGDRPDQRHQLHVHRHRHQQRRHRCAVGPFEHLSRPTRRCPDAPTGANAVAGDGQATVSWTAGDDGGSAITGYTVTTVAGWATTPASGTSVLVTGLTDGTAYTFTITATNGVGDESASDPSSPVTPTAPRRRLMRRPVWAQSPGDGQATVSWTAPAANGSPITGYTVTTSPGGATTPASGTVSARHWPDRWHGVHVHRHRDQRHRYWTGVRPVVAE